ncbi:hypothetical protein Tco_1369381, partial [Tanacetum coccineum]
MKNDEVHNPNTQNTSPSEINKTYEHSPMMDSYEQPSCLGLTFVSEALRKSDQMHQTFKKSYLAMTHKLDDMIELPKSQPKKKFKDDLDCEMVMAKIPKCMSWLDAYDEHIGIYTARDLPGRSSHDLFLSSRGVSSIDEPEPQPLPNFQSLDENLGDKRGTRLLELGKRDLSVDEYLGQYGSFEVNSCSRCSVPAWGNEVHSLDYLRFTTRHNRGAFPWMGLMTPDLACPLTHQLLWSSPGYFKPNMSFDMPASPEYLSGLAHASLAEDDLNELIIKYKIPRDLHPRLPLKEFVISELLDDAIGVYHHVFYFYGVRIPFSSFLLALIKHYKVHFTHLGPLGLNKVITFEVLCRSLHIEPTVTLFHVFHTLCKQGDWSSFAKRRAPSLIYIDDNHSCMNHWKSGFFLIDRRAIPNYMTMRHPSLMIDDPKPITGSYRMADVPHLIAHVMKLRDMPEGVLVLSGLSRVWNSQTCDPVLRGADGNVMGIHDFLCLPERTGAEVQEEPHHISDQPFRGFHFTIFPPPLLMLLSQILLWRSCCQFAMAQSSGSTTRPNLFADDSGAESDDDDDDDDDDDAC